MNTAPKWARPGTTLLRPKSLRSGLACFRVHFLYAKTAPDRPVSGSIFHTPKPLRGEGFGAVSAHIKFSFFAAPKPLQGNPKGLQNNEKQTCRAVSAHIKCLGRAVSAQLRGGDLGAVSAYKKMPLFNRSGRGFFGAVSAPLGAPGASTYPTPAPPPLAAPLVHENQ